MKIITRFMPEWLIWIDGTYPFIHIRRGRRVGEDGRDFK